MHKTRPFKQIFQAIRTTFIAMTSGKKKSKDPAKKFSINGSRHFVSTGCEARTIKLTINAATSWKLLSQELPDWAIPDRLSGKAGTSTLTFTLTANSGAARYQQIMFKRRKQLYPFTLQQSASPDHKTQPDYYFYATFGTMPALYAGLHLLSHDRPSYFFYERTGTFVSSQLPPHATHVPCPRENLKAVFKEKILEINAQNPNATFGFLTDDIRARLGHDFFVRLGISPSRVEVTLLSDGTGTYNEFYKAFGDATKGKSAWDEYKKQIDGLDWDSTHPMPELEGIDFDSFNWAYYLSTQSGYTLLLQNASLLETDSQEVKAELNQMKAITTPPLDMLNKLSPERKELFYRMSGFSKTYYESLFTSSPKPNLIIIGNDTRVASSPEAQRNYVRQIWEQYGNSHDIYFKPHPGDEESQNYEQLFPGLVMLPRQMPFEIMIWALNNLIDLIGGYPSTTFLTVPTEKVKFIFEATLDTIDRPLNLLFKNADVKWIV